MSQIASDRMETLGEWDHGVLVDDPLKSPMVDPKFGLREALVVSEHKLEGAMRGILEERDKVARTRSQDEAGMVEALGEWDHSVCNPDKYDSRNAQNFCQFVKNVERKAEITVLKMIQKGKQAVSIDHRTKEQIAGRTEEEVLGMKLCVSDIVRGESFETPCA